MRRLEVVLVDPEVGAELLALGDGQRLVVRARVDDVRLVVLDRRPQDRLARLRLEGARSARFAARLALAWLVRAGGARRAGVIAQLGLGGAGLARRALAARRRALLRGPATRLTCNTRVTVAGSSDWIGFPNAADITGRTCVGVIVDGPERAREAASLPRQRLEKVGRARLAFSGPREIFLSAAPAGAALGTCAGLLWCGARLTLSEIPGRVRGRRRLPDPEGMMMRG